MIKLLLIATLAAFAVTHVTQGQGRLFPSVDNVSGAPPLSAFEEEWYSKHLRAMGESQLTQAQGETYRFLWLRTFANPVVVRISCAEKRCDLTAVRLGGSGGYEPGSVVERKARGLSEQETTNLRELIGRAQLWQAQPPDSRIGLDGAQWVLEVSHEKRYHLWNVWSPESSGQHATFRELCLEMIRLSGLTIRSSEVY